MLIGDVDNIGKELVKATEVCVDEAIVQICKPGACFWHIGEFIERRAKELGFGIVPAFVGHGIGEYFHGAPDIFHISKYNIFYIYTASNSTMLTNCVILKAARNRKMDK